MRPHSPTTSRSGLPRAIPRGAILLEVIFSIAILAAAGATILGGFTACIRAARDLRMESQAADLAVTLLSEMQMGVVAPVDEGPTDYLEPLQDWSWQVATMGLDPQTESGATMTQVQLTVTYKPEAYSYTMYYLVPSSAETTPDQAAASATGSGGPSASAGGGP